jgi:exopolysaccharide/PEP-CTERM locus tyrosine autokinase
MSIIERATGLLRPLDWSDLKRSARLDSIERAARESSERSILEELGGPAPQSLTDAKPAQVLGRAARTLHIDRAGLRLHGMVTPDGARTPMAESFRRIKRQILANMTNAKPGVSSNLVLVTSALPGEGKTFCAINLAISIALEMDRTVLLVDADVAKPGIPSALGVEVENGLMDVLLRRTNLAQAMCNTDIDNLSLLPAGIAHQRTTELLASDGMRLLLQELAQRNDRIVIFDAPPLLAASEASVLASRVGQIVLVVEAGKTSQAELKDALGCIDSNNVAGLVLNKGESLGQAYNYAGR